MTVAEQKVLDYLENTGSSWAPLSEIDVNVTEDIKQEKLVYRERKKQIYVTFPYYMEMEKRIATMIVNRIRVQNIVEASIVHMLINRFEASESERIGKPFTFADEQREAIIMVVNTGFCIITGGPGTGKTSVLKCAVQVIKWLSDMPVVYMCAPTGKAARRITEGTGYKATTIHKVIGVSNQYLNIISANYLFNDEASMLDMETMDKILHSVLPKTRIVLVGDIDQLPSVGIGAILRDLISCNVVPYVELEKTFRQDSNSTLYDNIQIVKKGGYLPLMEGNDFKRIRDTTDIFSQCIKEYEEGIATYGLDKTVLLMPYRKESQLCSENMNRYLQNKINPIGKKTFLKTVVTREERKIPMIFQVDDPVIQLVNEQQVSNGDIGKVISVYGGKVVVQFVDCKITYDESNIDQLELAYALSIHKSQGSEYDCVITPFVKENKNLDRNMIYTAITRAKKKCVVIGTDEVIMDACKIQSSWKRCTFLCDEIEIMIKTAEIMRLLQVA